MQLKKFWYCYVAFLLCLAGYFLTKQVIKNSFVTKEITYTTTNASAVEMAWGIVDGKLPPKEHWPANTSMKDNMLYTKLNVQEAVFSTAITLPAESTIYYWMVQKKDPAGNQINIWDSGGNEKIYFTVIFDHDGIFKPGYFIFLAGFLPLLFLYLKGRKQEFSQVANRFELKEYIPQFDSIRAIAVLLVIIHHWFDKNKILNFLPNGPIGVNIFFVLSGFLITGILLKAKKQTEHGKIKRSAAFRTFYIRRTLRIFPIYYGLLFVFLLFQIPPIKDGLFYYLTYTANLHFYSGQFFPSRLAHLWSLAVEEQFYLLWPWLILLVNKRFLPHLISLFFVIGVSTNFILTDKSWWVEIFTPACFDAFSTGAFLSYLIAYRQDIIEKIQPWFRYICVFIFLLFLLDAFDYSFLPRRTTHALLAIALIYYCLFKNNYKLPNYILNNSTLRSLGKLSYGVYLYHLFVPELWLLINQQFYKWGVDPFLNLSVPETIKSFWLFIQEFSFLLLLSILSWKLIEKPINDLKSRFEYKKRKEEEVPAMETATSQAVSF